MDDLLFKILESNMVENEHGQIIRLHSAISPEEARFVAETIKKNGLKKAVEVGCAMGISSLAIAREIDNLEGTQHFIIDPFQEKQWDNLGIYNLRKAGYNNFTLIEECSEFALPSLVKQGLKFDFAFIDGWHTFDHTMIDFFYVNRLLEIGGVVMMDDVQMTGINRVARYIYNYPAYEFIGSVKNDEITIKRKLYEGLLKLATIPRYILGNKISKEFYNSRALKLDRDLQLDCTMIAFKKISEDTRPWNWYENF